MFNGNDQKLKDNPAAKLKKITLSLPTLILRIKLFHFFASLTFPIRRGGKKSTVFLWKCNWKLV